MIGDRNLGEGRMEGGAHWAGLILALVGASLLGGLLLILRAHGTAPAAQVRYPLTAHSSGAVCLIAHRDAKTDRCTRQDTAIAVSQLGAAMLVLDLPVWHVTDMTWEDGYMSV